MQRGVSPSAESLELFERQAGKYRTCEKLLEAALKKADVDEGDPEYRSWTQLIQWYQREAAFSEGEVRRCREALQGEDPEGEEA